MVVPAALDRGPAHAVTGRATEKGHGPRPLERGGDRVCLSGWSERRVERASVLGSRRRLSGRGKASARPGRGASLRSASDNGAVIRPALAQPARHVAGCRRPFTEPSFCTGRRRSRAVGTPRGARHRAPANRRASETDGARASVRPGAGRRSTAAARRARRLSSKEGSGIGRVASRRDRASWGSEARCFVQLWVLYLVTSPSMCSRTAWRARGGSFSTSRSFRRSRRFSGALRAETGSRPRS